MDEDEEKMMPPAWARDWVSERYREGSVNFVGVPEPHWRLAVLFCDVLAKAAETRSQIFIVPRQHVSGVHEPNALAVCYEGHTELAERIQLGHADVIGFHYSTQFHDGHCYLECINHWSTAIVDDTR